MKTRIELWKKYRNEIEENIEIEKALQSSDEKLRILYKRLLDAYPSYENEVKTIKKNSKIKLESIEKAKKYDSSLLQNILNDINESEKDYSSLSSLDKLNFSSKALDSVIKDMKKGKIKNIHYFNQEQTEDIELITKTVKLEGRNMKINIAIDGPSGSGKSSAAKLVANKYGLKYINTGLVYRAIALLAIKENVKEYKNETLKPLLQKGIIKLSENEKVYLFDKNITKEVRSDIVSQTASKVASIPEVRKYALEIMQNTGKEKGVVMDGRDITFRVLPNAELKFFIDTKAEVRAKRRMIQNEELGFNTNYDEILKEIEERDSRDKNRKIDPLQIVPDAIVIDSSNMSLKDVVDKISLEISKLGKV